MKSYISMAGALLWQLGTQAETTIAQALYGDPSADLFVIGVVGTDGKTTVSHLIHHIFQEHVASTALIAPDQLLFGDQDKTKGYDYNGLTIKSLLKTLSKAKDAGCKVAVVELSVSMLIAGVEQSLQFDMGILTNAELAYHHQFKKESDYHKLLKKLFDRVAKGNKSTKLAVFPKDDELGRKLYHDMPFDTSIAFSVISDSPLHAKQIIASKYNTIFRFSYLSKQYEVDSHLVGSYNVSNILAALAAGIVVGLNPAKAVRAINQYTLKHNHMDLLEIDRVSYYFDYAHTPSAIRGTLQYLQELKWPGRVIAVLGSQEWSHPHTRALLGQTVMNYSDSMIFTDDSPGAENRYQIFHQLMKKIGKSEGDNFHIIPERHFAMKLAVQLAQPGDFVVFVGKQHTDIQQTQRWPIPRNDVKELEKVLGKMKIEDQISNTQSTP